MGQLAYIEFDEDDNRYHLYSLINKNNRIYLHSVKETFNEVLLLGIDHFGKVEHVGRIYTDRILKMKKITNRLKDEIR